MKVKITAGTHIGIRGCYGEKTVTIPGRYVEKEVKDFIFDEFNYEITLGDSYQWKKHPGWSLNQHYSFVNKHGETLIEYYYKVL